jgi:hypothetical protein
MHEVRDVQVGGVSGATWDMVGSEMDGILGLEPNFKNLKADFVKQVALANRLVHFSSSSSVFGSQVQLTHATQTPDVFIDVYPESSLLVLP